MPAQSHTIRIAIVDTGIDLDKIEKLKLCPNGLVNVTSDNSMIDGFHHGSNLAFIINDRIKDLNACLIIVKAYTSTYRHMTWTDEHKAFQYVLSNHIDIVNFSTTGHGRYIEEQRDVEALSKANIMFVTSAGNEKENLDVTCDEYPACYVGSIVVGNMDYSSKPEALSNYGKRIEAWEYGTNIEGGGYIMTGTSQAAAIHTSKLARKMLEK